MPLLCLRLSQSYCSILSPHILCLSVLLISAEPNFLNCHLCVWWTTSTCPRFAFAFLCQHCTSSSVQFIASQSTLPRRLGFFFQIVGDDGGCEVPQEGSRTGPSCVRCSVSRTHQTALPSGRPCCLLVNHSALLPRKVGHFFAVQCLL